MALWEKILLDLDSSYEINIIILLITKHIVARKAKYCENALMDAAFALKTISETSKSKILHNT